MLTITVASQEELAAAIQDHEARGFVVQARDGGNARLHKPRNLRMGWLFLGALVLAVPVLLYLLVHLLRRDRYVLITVRSWATSLQAGIDDDEPCWDGMWWVVPSE
jgi:hypothetical protein